MSGDHQRLTQDSTSVCRGKQRETTSTGRRDKEMAILGIDIGGSGVKGAPVDTVRGEFLAERVRVPTPQPADVTSVVEAVAQVAGGFDGYDSVGITFPGVV